jgi:hypothetical protein
MSVICKSCGEQITGEFTGEIVAGTLCPHCKQPLVRNFTLVAGAGVYKITGNAANLIYTSYPEMLLAEAQDLKSRQQFSLAVVIAQMACEISVERAISKAFATKQVEYLEEAIGKLLPSRNITNDRVRKFYTALTDDEIQTQTFWPGLTELAKLRNDAVHIGKFCTEQEAEASLKTAGLLVEYLKNA